MLRGFQWDLARQVERLDWLLAQLPRYADWGYNELYLHLEDAVEFPSVPGVARADAYTYGELERLVATADRVGIKTVPIVNLLGHTQYLVKVPGLRDLNELRADDGSPLERGQICPLHPRTLDLARRLIGDMAPFCTAGKVHVGLDESFHLGRHPRSRREIDRIGLAAHFARYVGRLRRVAREHGLQLGLWADMLYFLPAAIPLLPGDVAAYEWYYYRFDRRPRVELFNFRESDVGERLRARGIEYWGCPMNGAFRYEPIPHFRDRLDNIVSWWRRCHRLDAAGMLVTSWQPNRLAMELTTVVDAAAASLWLDGIAEPRAMLERGFARVAGRQLKSRKRGALVTTSARAAARAALTADRYPFSGYPRWEINSGWDVVSRRESIAPYARELRCFEHLLRNGGTDLPVPLRASLELRRYLAFRDVWVRTTLRTGQPDLVAFRKAWTAGLRAARLLWTRTRHASAPPPNEAILRADLRRAEAWRADGVAAGELQLCYAVENFAPAAQLVIVEQGAPDGSWTRVQACYTIEFLACAARRRDGLRREHAAPLRFAPDEPTRVRLRVATPGQVRVTQGALVTPSGCYPVFQTAVIGTKSQTGGWPVGDSSGPWLSIEWRAVDSKHRPLDLRVRRRMTGP